MESKHEPTEQTSPDTYTENYRGFALTLEWRRRSDRTFECRAIATEAVAWETPWGFGWVAQLALVRRLVDSYVDARESCERQQQRRELAAQARTAGAGTVDLPTARPAVRS